MSLVAALMTMRARVRRSAAGKDSYGGDKAPRLWQIVAEDMPVYVWVMQETNYFNEKSVVVEKIKGYAKADANILRGDELDTIVDRRGREMIAGPLKVNIVTAKRRGASPSHLELVLQRNYGRS